MKKLWRWGLVALVPIGIAVWWMTHPRPQAVEMAVVERKSLTQSLDEDGVVRSLVEASLSCPSQGRLARIRVARGQKVRAGQLLAELDATEQRAALDQLLAQERASQASLRQAHFQSQLTQQKADADLRLSQSGLQVARAQALKVEDGVRPEQRQALQAALARAQFRLQETQRDWQRRRVLFEQGAVSRADLESYESSFKTAQTNLNEARARLLEAQHGPVRGERQAARAEVERSRASLEVSQAQQGQVEVALAAEEEAAHRLESLQAQIQQARHQLELTQLRAPASGIVEWDEIEPGEVVSPGQVILRLTDPTRLYVELLLDEGDRAQAKIGARVAITCDAYPGQTFEGKLQAIESQAFLKRLVRNSPTQDEDRVFRARVTLKPEDIARLHPGMSVFAQLILSQRSQVLTIPRQACLNREGKWLAYKVSAGRAHRTVVDLGQKDSAQVEIVGGLAEGDQVVLNPGNVADGAVVTQR